MEDNADQEKIDANQISEKALEDSPVESTFTGSNFNDATKQDGFFDKLSHSNYNRDFQQSASGPNNVVVSQSSSPTDISMTDLTQETSHFVNSISPTNSSLLTSKTKVTSHGVYNTFEQKTTLISKDLNTSKYLWESKNSNETITNSDQGLVEK